MPPRRWRNPLPTQPRQRAASGVGIISVAGLAGWHGDHRVLLHEVDLGGLQQAEPVEQRDHAAAGAVLEYAGECFAVDLIEGPHDANLLQDVPARCHGVGLTVGTIVVVGDGVTVGTSVTVGDSVTVGTATL